MKHGNVYYLELSRELFNKYTYEQLPVYSRWIFVVLNELEQRFTGYKEDYFFRSDENLAKDCGLSTATIKRYKKPLITHGLIQHWNMHYTDRETNKKSEKKVSAYRIIK